MTINATKVAESVLKRLDHAYNTSDATAYAALFTKDADFVNRFGMQLVGKEEIEDRHRVLFTQLAEGTAGAIELIRARTISD